MSNSPVQAKLINTKYLNQFFTNAKKTAKRSVLYRTYRKAGKVINDEGKRQVKLNLKKKIQIRRNGVKNGLLKSFGTGAAKTRNKVVAMYAGPRQKAGKYFGNIAPIFEKGTKLRYTKKGAARGKITGTRFWEKAVKAKKLQAVNIVRDYFEEAITRYFEASARRAAKNSKK